MRRRVRSFAVPVVAAVSVVALMAPVAQSANGGNSQSAKKGEVLDLAIGAIQGQVELPEPEDRRPPPAEDVGGPGARQVTPILYASFDDLPKQNPISASAFQSQLGGSNNGTWDYDDTSIVDDPRGTGKVIRTRLEKKTIRGLPSGANHGIVIFSPLDRVVDEACISYDIRYDENFDFDLGGKLPGLLGVRPGISPSKPTGGGNPGDTGFSARGMWLGPDAYSWANPPGYAVSYMYSPFQNSTYGDNLRWEESYQSPGEWHKVKQCQTMNTVGQRNGTQKAYFDGELVYEDDNYVFRTRDDVHINYLAWAIFRGGGDLNWASDRDGYVDLDNVLITELQNVRPVGDFEAAVTELTAEFSAQGFDIDGKIASYAWDFGDGNSSSDQNPTHVYAAGGSYPVKLTVTDFEGATGTVTKTVQASGPAANEPPVASFAANVDGLTVSFASTSTDPDGQIASQDWVFGDGTSSSEEAPVKTFGAPGTYNVTLQVTDDDGAQAEVTEPVTLTVATSLASDTFTRSVTDGWGSATTGGPWTITGLAEDFKVARNRGEIRLDTPGLVPRASLGDVGEANTDATVRFSLDNIPEGDGAYITLSSRSNKSANSGYRAKVRVSSEGRLTLYLTRAVGGIESTLGSYQLPSDVRYSRFETLQVRLQAEGTSPTKLRAKMWPRTQPEPTGWQLTATDNIEALQSLRGVALAGHLAGSAPLGSPVVVRFDDLAVVGPELGNITPEASFTTLVANRGVQFTSTSTDEDGSIVGQLWSFGDGTYSTEANPLKLYASTGTFVVKLYVLDNEGGFGVATQEVTTWPSTVVLPEPSMLDTFDRTVSNGWGSAQIGGAWTLRGGDEKFAVDGGVGTMTINAGQGPRATVSEVMPQDTDARASFALDKAPAGSSLYLSLASRANSDGSDAYRAKAQVKPDGTLGVSISKVVGNVETSLGSGTVPSGLSFDKNGRISGAGSDALIIRLQTEGTSPTTVRAKVWRVGTPQPSAWQVEATDSTAALQAAGRAGVWTYLSGSVTNAPLVVSVDNYLVIPSL